MLARRSRWTGRRRCRPRWRCGTPLTSGVRRTHSVTAFSIAGPICLVLVILACPPAGDHGEGCLVPAGAPAPGPRSVQGLMPLAGACSASSCWSSAMSFPEPRVASQSAIRCCTRRAKPYAGPPGCRRRPRQPAHDHPDRLVVVAFAEDEAKERVVEFIVDAAAIGRDGLVLAWRRHGQQIAVWVVGVDVPHFNPFRMGPLRLLLRRAWMFSRSAASRRAWRPDRRTGRRAGPSPL